MDAKARVPSTRVYEDFEPTIEWVHEEDCDNLLIYLPGFTKEQLRVQLTRSKNLVISGERLVDRNIWSRFHKEFPVSTNCDINKISAKFEGSILFVRQPKLITQAVKQEEGKPPMSTDQAPSPQDKAMNDSQPQKAMATAQEQAANGKAADKKSEAISSANGKTSSTSRESKDSEKTTPKEEKSDAKDAVSDQKATPKPGDIGSSEKQESTGSDDKGKKKDRQVDDDSGKKTQENYSQAVLGLATKLKMPRKVVNLVLVVLVALVLGLYFTNSVKSWRKAHES